MGKRVQTSLFFVSQDEMDTFNDVVVPLRENRQLRTTIIDLLSLLRTNPVEIEALLHGEHLKPVDKEAEYFIEHSKELDRHLQELNEKIYQSKNSIDKLDSDEILRNSFNKVYEHNQDKGSEGITAIPADDKKVDKETLKNDLKREVLSDLKESLRPVLQELVDGSIKTLSLHKNDSHNNLVEQPTKVVAVSQSDNSSQTVTKLSQPMTKSIDTDEDDIPDFKSFMKTGKVVKKEKSTTAPTSAGGSPFLKKSSNSDDSYLEKDEINQDKAVNTSKDKNTSSETVEEEDDFTAALLDASSESVI